MTQENLITVSPAEVCAAVRRLDDAQLFALVRPRLNELARDAFVAAIAGLAGTTPPPARVAHRDDKPETHTTQRRPGRPPLVQQAILRELKAGPARSRDLAALVGSPRASLQSILTKIRKRGLVHLRSDGYWVAGPEPRKRAARSV